MVSVIIPTYNRAAVVVEAVESALAQTCRPREVIVIDDGSTDTTRERLASYLDRIVYIHQENQGVSAARNRGLQVARGDLIAFLDSDDVWHPRKLEIQLQYLSEHPETGIVGAASYHGPEENWPAIPDYGQIPSLRIELDRLVVRAPFQTSSAVVRKSSLEAVGFFDTHLRNAEDRDLYIRIGSRFPLVRIEAALVRGTPGSDTSLSSRVTGEQFTRRMLLQTFHQVESIRGRFFLKRRALGYAAFEASYMHMAAGRPVSALSRILRSFLLWPLPYPNAETSPLKRVKRIVQIIRSLTKSNRNQEASDVSLTATSLGSAFRGIPVRCISH